VSRAITIRVSESVVRTVHVADGICAPIEMLPIVAPDRMSELLARELEAGGFERDGDVMRRAAGEDIEITVDLRAATVTVRIADEAELSDKLTVHGRAGARTIDDDKARLRRHAREVLDERIDDKADAIRQQLTRRLEAALADVRAELDAAVGRATVAALTERAGELGAIESIVDDGGGNITIKVKL
jgi:hypothetical protein